MFEDVNLPYYLEQLNWVAGLDILLVAIIIFGILRLLSGTRAVPMLRGLLVIALVLVLVDLVAPLEALRWLIGRILPALFVAIPVIFQPELRRALTQLGQPGRFAQFWKREQPDLTIPTLVETARRLSIRRHGALIIIERNTGLKEYIDTGVKLDADITTPILLNIFYKDADLHDGGVILKDGRIAAASCVMPLSNSRMSDRQMGLRHRAALGTSENSDAVVIVVSEETGNMALAHNGRILPRLSLQQLESNLQAFLNPQNQIRSAAASNSAES
ncbi:MAG: diadenylate cyclase CdaA [Candidatus Promineifilaceae bacterium]